MKRDIRPAKIYLTVLFATLAVSLQAIAASAETRATTITGAGSTFVYPVLAKWTADYQKKTGAQINYQSIGSGGGIHQIEEKTVDFGASDMPLEHADLVKNNLVQFPIISGATVPVVRVRGVKPGQLKLTGALLAQIYLGKINKWNDPQIAKLNPGLKLPEQAIMVVHRSDGSGTTFIWTDYLSKESAAWKAKVGEGTAVNWPVGVGGKGNEGVASYVEQIDGAIGYVEYAYARQNNMIYAQVKNRAGHFVEPTMRAFRAAAEGANWSKAKDYHLILTDAPGRSSWPIAGSTFILMQKTQTNPVQAREVLRFFRWAYTHGAGEAERLDYVPIPAKTVGDIVHTWQAALKLQNGAPVEIGL